ncbi:hypothetical protein, partial [Bacillus cereus group sp. Bce020]
PGDIFQYRHLIEEPYLQWITEQLPKGSKIGYDPRMHRASWLTSAQQRLAGEYSLVAITENPIDRLWQDRPAPVTSAMRLMSVDQVGID